MIDSSKNHFPALYIYSIKMASWSSDSITFEDRVPTISQQAKLLNKFLSPTVSMPRGLAPWWVWVEPDLVTRLWLVEQDLKKQTLKVSNMKPFRNIHFIKDR